MIRRRKRMLDDLDRDMADHIQRETEDNIDRGMTPEAARSAAMRSFGNVTLLKEQTRAVWISVWLEQIAHDLKYAARMLRRNPGFSITAVLTLALGMGMNVAMFSVVKNVILEPLPYPNPERLVWISNDCIFSDGDCFMARSDFALWKEQAQSFDSMALVGHDDLALVFRGESTTERVGSIQGDFWSITNAQPQLGRLFGANEADSIVLTSPFFERRFGGNPAVVGQVIQIDGHAFRVTGVLSGGFRNLIPQALYPGDEVREIDAYIPTPAGHEQPGEPMRATARSGPTPTWFRIVAKIRANISYEQARAEMESLFYQTVKQHPNPYSHNNVTQEGFRFQTLSERLVGRARPTLYLLLGAVVFVLLIAVVNIANLLLARASTREREIAIRASVGAGRARVIRQFLTESVLLALIGGAASVLLAYFALGAIRHIGSTAMPRLEDSHIDLSALLFALAVSLATGVLFGLAPALTFVRRNLDEVLRHDARTSQASPGQFRVRGFLVASEVALAMVLLIGAELMLKSFRQMTAYPAGLAPDRILTLRVSLSGPEYDRNAANQEVYIQKLFRRIEQLPGVEAFGIDGGQFSQPLQIAGIRPPTSDGSARGAVRYVSPGYLKALGMPLLAGRWPTEEEFFDLALVNESLVRKVGGNADLAGRRIKGSFMSATIAGVLADFKDFQLDSEPTPQVYTTYKKAPVVRSIRVAIRTVGNPLLLAEPVRRSVSEIDKTVPVFQVQTLEQELAASVAARRFALKLLAVFAGIAIFLAGTGIYGVIAYLVTQRTTEIGIRMALGAPRRSIVQMVITQGMTMVLAGIVCGLVSAAVLTRLMTRMLYGVRAIDAPTFAVVAAAVILAALLACAAPAVRAAFTDPMIVLRNE